MHRLTLTATVLLLLAGCQQPEDGTATSEASASPSGQPTVSSASLECGVLGTPTVVRYHSRLDSSTQHSAYVLNASDYARRATGCVTVMPVASVVTLRYRVAGI